ncbi:MAG: FtsX-like permease family protein [Eubacterium sp.]|nr:FtsX-like permease family protein [Eubacterium sp.]
MIKLVKANIHKDRAVLSAFLMIIILSVTLLHVGRMVSMYKALYDEKSETSNMGDSFSFALGDEETIKNELEDMDEVKEYRIVDLIRTGDFKIVKDQAKDRTIEELFFIPENEMNEYMNLNFVERDTSIQDSWIYINVYTAYYNRLKVGDKVVIGSDILGENTFTVAGIYEDLFCGNSYSYFSSVIDNDSFDRIKEKSDDLMKEGKEFCSYKGINVKYKNHNQIDDELKKQSKKLEDAGINNYGFTTVLAKTGYTGIITILAAFMAAFSVIIIIICFIMIIFTINNNIDRDIKNIGALRAVGFTNSQVRRAMIMEYSLVALVGSGIGIGLAYGLYPLLEDAVIREISGMVWEEKFYPMISIPILLGILLGMIMITVLSTIKLKNVHPATALRFGLASHSFKKNHIPLEKTHGGINVLLALKSTLHSAGQNIIVLGIILAVSFLTAFSCILFYNTKIDITKFQRLLQGDVPDAFVTIKYESQDEMYDIIEKLQNMEGVKQAYGLSSGTAESEGNEATLLWISKPEYVYCGVYEGEMLKEANEVVIGGVLADKLGVGVGDEITIDYNGRSNRFLVTGLQQAVYGFGERIYICDGGMEMLGAVPDYTYIRIRLENPSSESVDDFLESVKKELGDNCTDTENYYRHQRSRDNMPVYAVGFVITILIVLNIFTVIVVVRLLLKTIFIRREKEFGIKKAVGFTSRQLRLQLALSLVPVTFTAALVGSVMGNVLTNPLFNVIFKSFGVENSDLIIKGITIPITIVMVALLVFVVTFIMSGRMKKVSAYKLIQE